MYCRRAFHRLDFHAPAFLHAGTKTVFGEVINISNHGMYLRTSGHLVENAPVDVTVYFNGDGATASITVPVRVVRTDGTGAGMYSPTLSVVSFLELQTLLACVPGHEETIFTEFYRMTENSSRGVPPIPRYH